jgi:hypothetical protein
MNTPPPFIRRPLLLGATNSSRTRLTFGLFRYSPVETWWHAVTHRRGRGNWRMEWVASTLHTTSEHGVSSITSADAHTSAASSRLNWRPRRFKWTRPFRWKTKIWFLRVCHHISNAVYFTHHHSASGASDKRMSCGQLTPATAQVKNAWTSTSTPSHTFIAHSYNQQ